MGKVENNPDSIFVSKETVFGKNNKNKKERMADIMAMQKCKKPQPQCDEHLDNSDVDLLDSSGKFKDSKLEKDYQKYVNWKNKKRKVPKNRLEWKKASDYYNTKSPMARGNKFNKTVYKSRRYKYHEIYLENGKRLDSYDPVKGEIISRKATDLDKILEDTYRKYLSEFSEKYSRGTKIRSNAYEVLDGKHLTGQYILEIPATNESIENIDYYKDIAAEYDVILRFTEEIK